MRKILFSFGIVLLLMIVGCKEKEAKKEWSDLPTATSLDSLKATDFVPTLENTFNPERNTVYAAAFLYAWDSITKLLPDDLRNDSSYTTDFNLLLRSTSFRNSLSDSEYSVKVRTDGQIIIAEAFFNKTLPFPAKMEKADEPMLFGGNKVNAFGMYGIDEAITAYSQLLFYDNDDRFLLKFSPKDEKHELWLMKAADTDSTLVQVVNRAKDWKAIGEKETGNAKLAWKYRFNEDDLFSIPEIKFNIYTNYKKLEGQVFFMKGDDRRIATAYQRTGFILNETGAVAESHAVMAVVDSAGPMRIEQPQPKKMIFDKPFYIILKRTDSENPYFVMRVANAELLVKQQ